jgi:hypothetical protein
VFEANYSLSDAAFSRQLRPILDAHVPASIKGEIFIRNDCGADRICVPDLKLDAAP